MNNYCITLVFYIKIFFQDLLSKLVVKLKSLPKILPFIRPMIYSIPNITVVNNSLFDFYYGYFKSSLLIFLC